MRVKYQYLRLAKIAQTGTVEIDVTDPTDQEACEAAIRKGEFATFLPQDEEFDEETWNFAPLEVQEEEGYE